MLVLETLVSKIVCAHHRHIQVPLTFLFQSGSLSAGCKDTSTCLGEILPK